MGFSGNGNGGSISGASDAALSNPTNGQVLTYNTGTAKWQNAGVTVPDNSVTNAKFATSNTAMSGQLLSWNGTSLAWTSPPTGSSSLKGWEDATRAIYAISPSPESGLTAIAADASTNDAPRLQAMLNYIKTTYGGGQLFLPLGKTSNCNSSITIPAGVQVVGSQTARWDFWYAGSAVTAIFVNDSDFTPIVGLKLTGNQWDANASTHNTTTSVGLDITGNGLNFVDVQVGGFNWGVKLTNDNTYIISFERSTFLGCMVALNLDLDNDWSGASGTASNSGERIALTDCVIANCGTGYWATGNGADLYFSHVSIDFTTTFGRQSNAHVFFESCHLETTGSSYNSPYLFDLSVNPRLYMSNCEIVTGAAGVYSVINPANGPWNYGTGVAHFKNCYAQFTMTSAASAASAVSVAFSESIVSVPQNATSVTIAAFFVTKWNAITVSSAAVDGNMGSGSVVPRVSAMSASNGTVTITLSAPAPAGTFLEVSF